MMYKIHKENPLWWFSEVMKEWAGRVEDVKGKYGETVDACLKDWEMMKKWENKKNQ